METTFSVPQGSYELTRNSSDDGALRAWDAADEYILQELSESGTGFGGRTLVVNDGFGALAVSLVSQAEEVVSWNDSFVAHQALANNVAANNLVSDRIVALTSTKNPTGQFDLVLIKIPKHNSLLEDQLHRIRPSLTASSVVIAGGMTRHIHTSTLELFQRILGPTKTSLARKKARLAFIDTDHSKSVGDSPWPITWTHNNIEVVNHAGVFSGRKLDIGTRFFLDNLPSDLSGSSIVDLGCGNGIVGATLLRRNANAKVTFLDESYGAVASARSTVSTLGRSALDQSRFEVADVMTSADTNVVKANSVDLVLINPPFHSNSALSASISDKMFQSSQDALKPGGELFVVGNRHLGYHVKLKRRFGNCDVIASNSKFVLLKVTH